MSSEPQDLWRASSTNLQVWGLALQVRVPGNCASVSVPWVLLTWRRFSMHLKWPYCLIFSRKFFINAGYPVFEVGTKDKGVPSISWKHVWNRFRVSVDIYMMSKRRWQIWLCGWLSVRWQMPPEDSLCSSSLTSSWFWTHKNGNRTSCVALCRPPADLIRLHKNCIHLLFTDRLPMSPRLQVSFATVCATGIQLLSLVGDPCHYDLQFGKLCVPWL